jgi:hypothetical protein
MSKSVLAFIREGKANCFIGKQTLTLSDSFIENTDPNTLSQIKYSAIERIENGHGLFYIYISALQAYIVPESAFSDEEQKKTFFNILSEKTGMDFSKSIN